MRKATKYDISTTNIANLGTELEKKVKAASAANEKQWAGAGKAVGLQIWRIEKFQVVPWAVDQYGSFYTDDSYIVLQTYKRADALAWNVFFWLGETTTQDEAGTAAYKTVELDTILGGAPIQHREVQGYESDSFMSLFPKGVKLLSGGVESGFKHVKPHEYKPRLLHIKGNKKNIRCTQVPLSVDSLNDGDVFVLDHGLTVYQWHGPHASVPEKAKGAQVTRALDDERGGKVEIKVIEPTTDDADSTAFWAAFGGKKPVKSKAEGGSDEVEVSFRRLFRLKEESGKFTFTKVAEGKIAHSLLDSSDVFILDTGVEVFTWVGKKASTKEREHALSYAQNYLNEYKRPAYLSICRILEGGENEVFHEVFTS
eukprot:TRINITY_DN1612_c0_g3_i1.p1 TRINITY_DN1612_c0_g3~~TRINITY_DN1612_c0_g3_i1.p1  ORF type:complete len:379 (-),score=137.40 TRINITY_DN1612_c0_g3_i1:77-1183(-)